MSKPIAYAIIAGILGGICCYSISLNAWWMASVAMLGIFVTLGL